MRTTILLSIAAPLALAATLMAQSTAFTYQGELTQGGTPANGLFDMRFRVFDAPTGGSQPGPTACLNDVSVMNGRFTAVVDLGQQFASTSARYLDIEVRQNTGLTCANTSGYTTLSPRQPLSVAPRAGAASVANALAAPDGAPIAAVLVDNAGNIGVGTASPQASVHIVTATSGPAAGQGVRIQGSDAGASSMGYLSFHDSADTQTGYVGDGSGGDASIFLSSNSADVVLITGEARTLVAKPSGRVGIGTSDPVATLDVNGTIHMAPVLRSYTMHGYEFRNKVLGSTSGIYEDNGLRNLNFSSVTEYVACPHLPDGAVIIAMELLGVDNRAGIDMACRLGRTNFQGGTLEMATIITNVGSGPAWQTSSILFPTVDNDTHAYWVRVGMSGAVDGEHRLTAVRLIYRIEEPLP